MYTAHLQTHTISVVAFFGHCIRRHILCYLVFSRCRGLCFFFLLFVVSLNNAADSYFFFYYLIFVLYFFLFIQCECLDCALELVAIARRPFIVCISVHFVVLSSIFNILFVICFIMFVVHSICQQHRWKVGRMKEKKPLHICEERCTTKLPNDEYSEWEKKGFEFLFFPCVLLVVVVFFLFLFNCIVEWHFFLFMLAFFLVYFCYKCHCFLFFFSLSFFHLDNSIFVVLCWGSQCQLYMKKKPIVFDVPEK